MPGTHLSRWTLSWFAASVAFLLLALALAVAFAPGPGDWQQGRGLALVHLLALGWLTQAMIGALLQFLPVLLARPLLWPGLAPFALGLTGAGAAMLALGFLRFDPALLSLAPLLLGAGFAMVAAMALGALIPARGWRDGTGGPVLLALGALALVAASGGGMARALAGAEALTLPVQILPLHIGLGVAGWLGLAAMGVSYRLFAMFLIAPDRTGPLRRITLVLAMALVALLAAGLLVPAMACASVAAGLYLADIAGLWRRRLRAAPEVNMAMSRPPLAFLALAAALALPAALAGGPWAEAAVFAALIGWLSGLTLAQMVKITGFLTWIQVFAPRIGREALPQVHELVDEPACRRWLALWSAGAGLGTLALLAGAAPALRLAFALLLIAALGLARELIRIRRLARLGPGRTLPPLFLPLRTDPIP